MSNDAEIPHRYIPPASRDERVRDWNLTAEAFAAKTGASAGFSPTHAREWMRFWQSDICEKGLFHTCFPPLSLPEGRRVWLAMEENFFAEVRLLPACLARVVQQRHLVRAVSGFARRRRHGRLPIPDHRAALTNSTGMSSLKPPMGLRAT
jgi:hypothetical protein